MNTLWCLVLVFAGPPAAAISTKSPAANTGPAAGAREVAVPIQVMAPGDPARAMPAEISVVTLTSNAAPVRRGTLVAHGTTGPNGEPCTVRLAPSADRLLIEARQSGGDGAVLGSTVIALDRESLAWTPLMVAENKSAGDRSSDLIQDKPVQPTVLVRIPERARTRIYVVASQYDRLPNFAGVMVLATNGKCIRRGSPSRSGEGFDADRDEPLDPRYRRLWVVAAGTQGGRSVIGRMLIVFDHNNWRPATRFDDFEADAIGPTGHWRSVEEYHAAAGQFAPIVDGAWSPPQIRVKIPAQPLPVWNSAPTGDAARIDQPSCCQRPSGHEPIDILERLGLRPELPPTPAVAEISARDSAIVEAGRPFSPDHEWADFGRRWIRGPSGMFWQTDLGGERL
jgi:hypothetical protein